MFDQVPNEVIQHLLMFLPPEDNLTFQLASRRLCAVARSSVVWRRYCATCFQYWHPRHDLAAKLAGPVSETDWTRLYLDRKRHVARARHLLDRIITSEPDRASKYEEIGNLGYDVKDFLLEQAAVSEDAPDFLARRYHSTTMLESMHRSMAIAEWQKLLALHANPNLSERYKRKETGIDVERLVAAFDMFVLFNQPGDMDDISRILDGIASRFRDENQTFAGLTTRRKALTLARWMRLHHLTGMRDPQIRYRDLCSSFLGQVLRSADHDSLPMISNLIFTFVAKRLGLDCKSVVFPENVYVLMFGNPDESLNGPNHSLDVNQKGHPAENRERMYLDPFRNANEVPLAALKNQLTRFGDRGLDYYSEVSTPSAIARRCASSIQMSTISTNTDRSRLEANTLLGQELFKTRPHAQYAFRWASLMLAVPGEPSPDEWNNSVYSLMKEIIKYWPCDMWLVQRHLEPLYTYVKQGALRTNFVGNVYDPRALLEQHTRAGQIPLDRLVQDPSQIKPGLPLRIGQPFRHTRYGWMGLITGWASRGSWEPMPPGMSRPVDRPADVRVFYTCIQAEEHGRHVVDKDSVHPITDPAEVLEPLRYLAGRYFLRFDEASCFFVSHPNAAAPSPSGGATG